MKYKLAIESASECPIVRLFGGISDDVAPWLAKNIFVKRPATFGVGSFSTM